MTDSATLKIDRAAKHVAELNKLFRETHPFSLVLKTNTTTGERAISPKRDKAIVDCAAGICGDAIHNLRSALDHAYFEIVSPFAANEVERTQIQFPFRETRDRFEKAVTEGFPKRVSPNFMNDILGLRAFKEGGGNKLLYLIHEFDVLDKHKLLIPTCDYTELSSEMLRPQIPDLPKAQITMSAGGVGTLIAWRAHGIPRDQLGTAIPPTLDQFERELDVPVHIIFVVGPPDNIYPVVATLNKLIDVVRKTIKIIRAAAQ